ncbi:MAG: hypothetical protein HOQ07_07495, partial [Sinomonas sp.]|nr:hypothetical protein [Sinomonas sp.]
MSWPGHDRKRRAQVSRLWHPGPRWLLAVDAAAILTLAGVSLAGLHLAYGGDLRYLVAGGVGAVLGVALAFGSSAA